MAEMLLRKSVHRKMMLFPACCSYNDVEICHLIIKLLYIKTIIFPKFVQINITNSFNYSLCMNLIVSTILKVLINWVIVSKFKAEWI